MTTFTFKWRGLNAAVDVEVQPFIQGRIDTWADDCYPDDGGEWDLEEFRIEGVNAIELLEINAVSLEIEEMINQMIDGREYE
ncbi:hypothetical protein UFOVP1082_6 [uncultured Caudovirales phage]|uniref:Uncharacterized protein n=1 Tax=uncultured Caudovirales phage TaxID=2100421 RepID=A0A6J5RZZ4_9CAUD|nr:hypothetical protein UFOVP906_43 [uncultured Caudovirales phage]CAB4176201.1 hypothetical protein UFOVP992_10 [uncultured Caudovirales phage]CAB4182907.1 hypothetical protein UFOVP1082_6 [uncultured Caudovirales phage]CAB4197934.1 hypothetical protein UFOVP1322_50 [uncultured Caudovirales phage]CAB4212352.1 hypothetical protein UFOVP1434_13 [uncultured Caudovirales phage]